MFEIRRLDVLTYGSGNGFTLWHYKCGSESMEAVRASGYFTDAADSMATGDMIMVSGAEGATILVVGSTEGGVMTAPLAS